MAEGARQARQAERGNGGGNGGGAQWVPGARPATPGGTGIGVWRNIHGIPDARPALCVKVCYPMPTPEDLRRRRTAGDFGPDVARGFTGAYVDSLTEATRATFYDAAIDHGWDLLQEAAREIYGPDVYACQNGRSGGWLYLSGGCVYRGGVRPWNRAECHRWRRFARQVHAIVREQGYRYLWQIWANVWQPTREASINGAAFRAASVAALCDCDGGA